MRKEQYRTPVVLWGSYWKQNGTEVKVTKSGEEYRVPTYALYGVPNKEYKSYLGSKK
jgi:hypothetical protein